MVHNLRPEMPVVSNLYEVLDARHQRRDQVHLHHLNRLLTNDDFGVHAAERGDIAREPRGGKPDNVRLKEGAVVEVIV